MPGSPRSSAAPSTLYIGRVAKVTGATATVIIPELGGPTYTYGPARTPEYDPTATVGPTRPLAAGDPVLVGLLASNTGNRDTVVIVARLA